jgi:hypothetical protein
MATAAKAERPFGSLFRHLEAAVPVIPFDSGNTRTVELSRSYLIKRLILRLTGSITFSAGTPTAVGSELPLALVKSIEIIADGRKTIFRAAGKDLFRLAHITNGKRGELTAPNFAASPAVFSTTIIIDHQALRFVKPVDTYLDPRGFEKLELRVTWGTLADLATGGTNTAVAATTQISGTLAQSTEGERSIIASKLVTTVQKDVTATNPLFEIVLPRTGLLAAVLFRTERDGVAVDNILNRVTLVSDNNINHVNQIIAADLQRRNVIDYQLDLGGGADGQITGYYFLDLTEDGRLMSALNTFVLNELKFLLDVTRTSGVETIFATMLQFEPAAGR